MLSIQTIFLSSLLLSFTYAGQQPIIPDDTGRQCPPGFFENGNACQPCPLGSFRGNSNLLFCSLCPPGTIAMKSLTQRTGCNPCPNGNFQSQSGQTECNPCPLDTSTNGTIGASKCDSCPPGSFTGEGSSRNLCIFCPPGEFFTRAASLPGTAGVAFQEGQGRCELCPRGTFTDITGTTECQTCPPGQTPLSRSGPCTSCKPGTFLSSNTNQCEPCQADFYQPLAGASECIPCPAGSAATNIGSTSCLTTSPDAPSCPAGSGFGANGTKEEQCVKCAPDFASPSGSATSCVQCYNSTSPTADGSTCACATNFQFLDSSELMTCEACDSGSTSSGVPGDSCACPKTQYLDRARGRCVCPPKQRFNGSACIPCAADAVLGEGDCDFCAAGSGLIGSSERCEDCGPFAVQVPTFGACVSRQCGPDQTLNIFRGCRCKQLNFVIDKEDGLCKKCPLGTGTTSLAQNECRPCGQGRPPRIFNGTDCEFCDMGGEVFNGTCVPECAVERDRDQVTGKCVCRNGPEVSPTECGSCGDARSLDASTRTCRCISNSFEQEDGSCVRCPGGTISDGNSPCRPCGSLQFRPQELDFTCRDCEQADPDVVGADTCIPAKCKMTEFIGKSGECQSCPSGTRLLNRTCVKCQKNQVSAGGRIAFCSVCTDGMIPNKDRSACVIV